jgi:hypothetical protein
MNSPVDLLKEEILLHPSNLKSRLFGFLFGPLSESHLSKTGNYLVLGTAYLTGMFQWVWLINFGNVHGRLIDWQMFYDFYKVTQDALIEKSIPYFMPYFYKGTNQFLAIPATDLFPTIYFLKFLSVEDFFLAQMTVAYSLGFVGCLWLRKNYQWSLFTFVFFFLIFNLNGHIVSHLAVGHWLWISYFLFPFFVGWVLRLVEGDVSSLHGVRLFWVLFVMLLFGGLHPFVWSLLFLGVLCLFHKKYWRPVSIGVALAMVFSSYRIIPAAVTFFGYAKPFQYGFPSISTLWKSLTDNDFKVDVFDWSFMVTNELTWWETDHYISIAGLVVILYFGIWSRLKGEKKDDPYRILNIPLLIFTLFSIGDIFGWITYLPIPLITVERVSTRFLIVPVLFLLVLATIWMQQFFERLRPSWSALVLALIILLYEAFSLINHLFLWKEQTMGFMPDIEIYRRIEAPSDWAKSVEGYYISTIQVSYMISLVSILAFVGASLYFKMKRKTSYKEA